MLQQKANCHQSPSCHFLKPFWKSSARCGKKLGGCFCWVPGCCDVIVCPQSPYAPGPGMLQHLALLQNQNDLEGETFGIGSWHGDGHDRTAKDTQEREVPEMLQKVARMIESRAGLIAQWNRAPTWAGTGTRVRLSLCHASPTPGTCWDSYWDWACWPASVIPALGRLKTRGLLEIWPV